MTLSKIIESIAPAARQQDDGLAADAKASAAKPAPQPAERGDGGSKYLNKASLIELFFDLVFIFCMRQFIPLISDAQGDVVSWYTFYTFCFTVVLLLQIWFDVTQFMNGFGTGEPLDVLFLITNVFLLIVMSQAASVTWELYLVYNTCWMLILINCCIHWVLRYFRLENPDPQLKRIVVRTVCIMVAQIAVIFISDFCGHVSGQVLCFIALALGFFAWSGRDATRMNINRYHHLAERCSLLVVMTFGETLIAAGHYTGAQTHVVSGLLHVLTILVMFLVYVVELERALDVTKLKSGLGIMAITTWQTFVAANYTAAFELMVEEKSLWLMDGSLYFSLSLAVFLLSFFLYLPYNKRGRMRGKRWVVARIVACLACCAASRVFIAAVTGALDAIGLLPVTFKTAYNFSPFIATGTGLVLVLMVLVMDWRNYGEPPKKLIGKLYGDFNESEAK